jgi:putative ABC transport system permease protein
VISLAIGRRTREIRIRFAIGTLHGDIVSLVLHECVRPVLAGLTSGIAVALGMSPVVASVLYEVAPSDPLARALVRTHNSVAY